MLHNLRLIASFALAGSAFAGVAFGWVHCSFDVHAPGALLGALIGVLFVRGESSPTAQ